MQRMSSVHSQSSDTVIQQQMNAGEVQAQGYSGKTPAIREEEEESGAETGREKRTYGLRKKKSFQSSPNSSLSSNSNGNSNRSVSTITFEKQKVIPHRARTQSAQSVLSSISLRSLLHQNNVQNQQAQQQQQQQNGEQEAQRVSSYTNFNEQIQSPAMSSIRKKGISASHTGGTGGYNVTSGASATATGIFRRNSSENEIGMQMPFTDDNRPRLDSATTRQQLQRQNSKISFKKENVNPNEVVSVQQESSSYKDEDADIDSQKRLTTQALRKLSTLKHNVKDMLNTDAGDCEEEQDDLASCESSAGKGEDNSEQDEDQDESRDVGDESFVNQVNSMTHLKFGNKNVVLDSSSFDPSEYSSKASQNHIARPPVSNRKHSLDVIRQPNASIPTNSTINHSNKRSLKQIGNPKKPLYVPAVLRDVSETNITIDDVVRPVSPQHTLVSRNQNMTLRSTTSASSQASVISNHSSILEACKRRLGSFFLAGADHYNSDSQLGLKWEPPAPPTREHWLPDSKRSSCHYCHKLFTFLERKHHCRHCGDIFCQQHLAHWLYLNSNAQFMIGGGGMGTLSKICDNCLEDYESMIKNPNWKDKKDSRQIDALTNTSSVVSQTGQSRIPQAINVASSSEVGDNTNDKDDVMGSVVGSVPADWNWSSF
ncbi:hypothetical protein HG536_0D04570 [Torulaspora globosa]|uniref:FYVE-type domain-containing protein n=1 Tax=Torulaspora globosa TaxID=48254 RepID=A0A7G3ZHE9_9SACH|nr:uncharacterized protein HG536_0D04570 [Torulaspora globosa]QLL32935.1 hypothetical protein HG536_0D04570 [Torulaspora globosa]